MKEIVLTNMGLIIDGDKILVEDRKKNDWPGITLPGGKVKDNESIKESMIREMREETNLLMIDPICVGYIEWNIEDKRHLCLLFKSDKYKGEIASSAEGEVFFVKINEIKDYNLSQSMDEILDIYGLKWR